MKTYKCVLCDETFKGYGNNPAPLKKTGRCCDFCNSKVVMARISEINKIVESVE
jgi:hypothetical protein